ncbi:MAG: aminodeoxychorismate synthase component I [Truepera sp.]|nr:aminodeoxychorismate synthase component I [Truepera sp.]
MSRFAELPDSFLSALQTPGSVLLESSRPDPEEHTSLLFSEPLTVLTLSEPRGVAAFFADVERYLAAGYFLAGYFAYELGYALQGLVSLLPELDLPLAWLGVYRQPKRFDHRCEGGASSLHRPVKIDTPSFGLAPESYATKLRHIRDYLEAGDCYQINFTDRFTFSLPGSPLALYQQLKTAQRVPYGAYLNTPEAQFLSLSPELFFRVHKGTITAKPMKGTLPRGRTPEEDAALSQELQQDPKSRAENVMIVDLLRNDLGRVCQTGSVRVPKLFTAEAYDGLLQMTSTVTGRLRPEVTAHQLFASLFPCGSVTGAPKRRAMEIIRELEARPRGIYTGAIGYLAPDGDATFNVAIRTLTVRQERAELGVGSGIVIDSKPTEEYAECLLKARFLTDPTPELSGEALFTLFETLRWEAGYPFLNAHLARLSGSAAYFNYPLSTEAARTALLEAAKAFQPKGVYRVKLSLHRDGRLTVAAHPFTPDTGPVRVVLAATRTDSRDRFYYHKTSHRPRYAEATRWAQQHGLADVLFFNERGELTEGAISNVFIERGGDLLTPALACGLLPGVYRQHLLATRANAREAVLSERDLFSADAIYLCSALRGLRRVSALPARS